MRRVIAISVLLFFLLFDFGMVAYGETNKVKLDFIQLGKPTQNSFIERFNRTYRYTSRHIPIQSIK